MHLKIEFDNTEKIYSFPNSSLIKIGRSPECDIQLLVDGISRFHLEVLSENGDIYVRDLETTNGTFLNDERLLANEKIAFNSFFPIKLGFNVWVSLLDEEEANQYQKERKIKESPKLAHSGGTTRIIKKPIEAATGRTNPGMKSRREIKEESSFLKKSFLPLIFMAGFFVYAVIQKEDEEIIPQVTETKPEVLKAPKVEDTSPKITKTSETLLKSSLTSDKCLTALEKTWCDVFTGRHSKKYYDGAYFFLGTMFIVQDFETFSKEQQDDLSLNDRQKREASILAKREHGKDFDGRKFMNEGGYRIQEADPREAKIAYVFLDFIRSSYAPLVNEEKSIEKIVYVLKENENDFFSYEIPVSHIEAIKVNQEELLMNINFLLVTGYEGHFQRLRERLKL